MPRVSAGTAGGPGWGCTCPSHLRVSQYHIALGRGSEVIWEHVRNDLDGTIVFRAWSDPQNAYDVTLTLAGVGARSASTSWLAAPTW